MHKAEKREWVSLTLEDFCQRRFFVVLWQMHSLPFLSRLVSLNYTHVHLPTTERNITGKKVIRPYTRKECCVVLYVSFCVISRESDFDEITKIDWNYISNQSSPTHFLSLNTFFSEILVGPLCDESWVCFEDYVIVFNSHMCVYEWKCEVLQWGVLAMAG